MVRQNHRYSTEIYLIRHVKPQVDTHLCYGQTDVPAGFISPAQRAHLIEQLPASAAVYSSPLTRCTQLARTLFPASVINVNPLLMELNFGSWEMTAWEHIERAQLNAWASNNLHFAPPQGESFNELCLRVEQFVRESLQPTQPAIIITHGGVIKAFEYLFGGMPLEVAVAHKVAFGSIRLLSI
ncbi:MAG: alpha-ribazole phosphatase [Moraxellaceae bacterium]|nr:MAG: alpha-ribazole phosphatase [Moraxellaceae bacterium]